jgi:hypothetical protein
MKLYIFKKSQQKVLQVQQPLHGFGLIGWVQILESMTKIDGTPKGFD